MEDFANLLHRDYGLKPQGKMAPMSAKSGETATAIKGKNSNNNINSHHSTSSRSGRTSFPGDENDLFFGTSNNKTTSTSSSSSSASARNANAYDDVFGGPPKFAPPKPSSASSSSIPLYDDIFRSQPPPPPAAPTSKDHSLPVFDTPYEDDIFLGVRGTRSSGVAYDNVFGGGASSSGSPSEDLLGGYRSGSSQKAKVSSFETPPAPSYDDEELLPGLRSGYTSSKPAEAPSSTFISVDDNAPAPPAEVDPFAGIQSVPYSGMPSIADPLDPFMETAPKSSSSNGAETDGLDGFDIFSQPNNHVKSSSNHQRFPRTSKDSTTSDTEVKSVRQNFSAASKPTVMEPDSDASPPKSTHEDYSPGDDFGSAEFNDATDQESWITVDKVRLVTDPTVAPPPSRPPPGFGYEQRTAVKQDSDEELNGESQNEDANDAAMKEAYEKAEARLKLEKERENQKKKEKEEQERLQREREDREKERQRKAVERATQEARERAANAARERIAVERATNEARERAAAEARQKAERERAERAASERAAAERAVSESRARAQRAALEKLNAERAQRAAAEAAAAAAAQQNRKPDDLDSFFNPRANSAPKQRPPTSDSSRSFGSSNDRKTPSSTPVKKASSVSNIDELTNLFDPPTSSFKEIDGETEDRRKARFDRDQRTQARARQALEEKHRRDLAAQREHAEKQRASESLDAEIKRWAAGKEGNIRALLSTLQYVLWPECGWQPVSLTDLITGASVKKVYRKATLCVHPDKVQQKGATVQQKYIAEKVFDLLKESWNKFNSEELF